ncbi:MAG: aldehyde dehydrogenase [Tissierellia bacterium]|nr:aldehyde dehydrogenase [Tissierellia bacterium]
MEIEEKIEAVRDVFNSGLTKSYDYRVETLDKLYASIDSNTEKINNALKSDLNKSDFEGYMTEVGLVLSELSFTRKHLKSWMSKDRKRVGLTQMPGSVYEMPEPYGVALIMAPWNYPFQLLFVPLIGAIAAGNCAILKTSKDTPETSKIMKEIIEEVFANGEVVFFEGGREINTILLEKTYDYIFFTGSEKVGRIVMEAASKNLTPVTLELGGKSPCIVDNSANIKKTAKRIVFGKLINSGQTCIAPDYVLVDEIVKKQLIEEMEKEIRRIYHSEDYYSNNHAKIINCSQYERLISFMEDEDIIFGGNCNDKSMQIDFTLIDEPDNNSIIMGEEIFGPLLPIISYKDIDDAVKIIKSKPKPLALYLFSNSDDTIGRILGEISFGGGCVNDTVTHFTGHHTGFGGVGNSGMGRYHGKNSFDTFSHKKTIFVKSEIADLDIRYHPYTNRKLKLIKKILK